MPKTTAPLFSVSASGTVARIITFRAMRVGNRVQVRPFVAPSPSAQQRNIRAIARAARDGWRAADLPTKAAWQHYALHIGLPTYAAWLQEWMRQRPAAATDLLVPAIT